jgi:transcriptional regulator with XRE-family HTH domain
MNRPPVSPLIGRALDIALKRLGKEELCKRLGVSQPTLDAWRLGHIVMPQADFLHLIDILTTLDIRWSEWNP